MQYLALGEVVKQLDKLTGFTLQDQVPDQDWKGIMGFRDVLAHQYFNIDPRQVLWITRKSLPPQTWFNFSHQLQDLIGHRHCCFRAPHLPVGTIRDLLNLLIIVHEAKYSIVRMMWDSSVLPS
jgi:hypothetical protein